MKLQSCEYRRCYLTFAVFDFLTYISRLLSSLLFVIISLYSGAGGMADTRDPDAKVDEDSRKSISAAPSFEEYLKQRDSE